MFRHSLIPLWIGIALLSGMFLVGQQSWSPEQPCTDNDGDGYGNPASPECTYPQLDCNNSNRYINPGVLEGPHGNPVCMDDVDNDCDGFVDDLPGGCSEWDMAEIPGGCFDMGDAFNEGNPDESPVHNVCITAFEMDVHEVTNAEYAECVDVGVCSPPIQEHSHTRLSYYGNPDYDHFPVIWVNWYQSEKYCRWAGKRLPTEAEWEYAVRGGLVSKRYPWGDSITGSDANYFDSGDPWDNDTGEIEYYAPNGYGLYDMTGNVWEWVNDWHQNDYYSDSPTTDPPGPASGTARVTRGGSWDYNTYYMRVAFRYGLFPDHGYSGTGCRCAR